MAMRASLIALLSLFTASVYAAAKYDLPCNIGWKKPLKNKVWTVPVGTKCTWTWDDAIAHCVTPRKPNAMNWKGSKQVTQKGYKYSQVMSKTGSFKVSCCVHIAFMRVTIKVVKKAKGSLALHHRSALERPAEAATCSGKCYGANSLGEACGLPKIRNQWSCSACCTLGRSKNALGVDECVAKCAGNVLASSA